MITRASRLQRAVVGLRDGDFVIPISVFDDTVRLFLAPFFDFNGAALKKAHGLRIRRTLDGFLKIEAIDLHDSSLKF